MKNKDDKIYGRVQIRASVCSTTQMALELMSKKNKTKIGRIIDKALLSHEEFLPYLEKVQKLYDY